MPQDTFAIDDIVDEVFRFLSAIEPGKWTDVYVWSDGSVSGPKPNDSNKSELKQVALFTPDGTLPSRAEVKLSIENGLAEAN